MKKIKIFTRHTPSNYGSILQSIATLEILKSIGHEPQIVDYQRKDERGLSSILAAIQKKGKWNTGVIKRLLYIAVRYPVESIAAIKFDKFRKQHLSLTKRCFSHAELLELKGDVFMTGSDQVWGPIGSDLYDSAYFLSHVSDGAKKISFASSFGKTEFTNDIVSRYKQLFKNYDKIAVRESSAVSLLNDWNIPCAGQVLDPTLLFSGTDWSHRYITKEISKRYVLIYQLHKNPVMDKYAKDFSEAVGLPLLRISPSLHQITRGGKLICLPDLGDFLSYIKNATYFITDSFHGTAFALNFNVQFIEILPNNKTGTRNQSILKLTNLENRIITDYNDFSIKDQKIDYSNVNEILESERKSSISILKTILE